MAFISKYWQISDIGGDVTLVEFPGEAREKVHFKGDLTNKSKMKELEAVVDSNTVLTETEKRSVMFWAGFFYAVAVWKF